jgi:hypothetical protein
MNLEKPIYFRPSKRKGLYHFIGWMLLLLIAIVFMLAGTGYFKKVFSNGPLLKEYLHQYHKKTHS